MSRIGKKVIKIPKDVSVNITGTKISVKGKHGSLEREVNDLVILSLEDNNLFVKRVNEEKNTFLPWVNEVINTKYGNWS